MTRRDFVALAAAGLAAGQTGAAEAPLPIVDTHQHLWDLKKFRLPWVKKGDPLDRAYLMADYLKAAEGLNVAQTVYMEVDVDPGQQTAEADYVIDLCRRADNPMTAAVISGRPESEDFAKYVRRFRDSASIKGVRRVLHGETPAGHCLARTFVANVRLLGDLGLSFDLCMRPEELADAAKLVDACPGTRFILDHCGNGKVQAADRTQWQRDMAAVAKRKNVVGKVSGIVAGAKPGAWTADDLAPVVKHTLEVFGPDRAMFGGDWPVCTRAATLGQWVAALKAIVRDRPRDEQKKLFHDNAVSFYGLRVI